MAGTAPVFTFTDLNASAIITLTLLGSGSAQTIPQGTWSLPAKIRIYNNLSASAGVADAVNCVLAAYDTGIVQGGATQPQTVNQWLAVQVLDYNGATTNADAYVVPIWGTVKHAVPVNNGILSGSGANYITVLVQVLIGMSAAGGTINQGLWLEANYNL